MNLPPADRWTVTENLVSITSYLKEFWICWTDVTKMTVLTVLLYPLNKALARSVPWLRILSINLRFLWTIILLTFVLNFCYCRTRWYQWIVKKKTSNFSTMSPGNFCQFIEIIEGTLNLLSHRPSRSVIEYTITS